MVSALVLFKIEIKSHWLSHQFSIHYIFFYSEISQVNLLVVALHQFQVAKNHKLVGCLSLIHLLSQFQVRKTNASKNGRVELSDPPIRFEQRKTPQTGKRR